MNQPDKVNIFNIPAHYHFFESLYDWLALNFSERISDIKIFLPNRRSCRELTELFLQKNPQNSAIILPKIKAISDISYEDFFDFLPDKNSFEIQATIDELIQAKVISDIDYLFFLSKEIQKLSIFGNNLESNQALNIANHIKNLFDEIEREEINLEKIDEIDDSDLSLHRQVTLEFLQNFHRQIKNSFIKNNIYFTTSYQNLIINKFIEILEEQGAKYPIIMAGSTGSVSFGKKLIKAISAQTNCHIILHGLEENLEERAEHHPQFLLNELIKFLQIDKKQIKKIAQEKFKLSSQSRSDFISMTMLEAEKTLIWQKDSDLLSGADLAEKFKIIEAKDEFEEAKIIALILSESLDQNKKSAVITNNQKLGALLKSELNRLALPFNDTRNIGIFDSKLVNFILLILELLESDFSSAALLALLKNPLCFYHQQKEILQKFEIEVLRQDRISEGLNGIEEKLQSLNNQELSNFFQDFYSKLSHLKQHRNNIDIGSYISEIIAVAEKLSAEKWQSLLAKELAQIELFDFFEKLKNKNDFFVNSKNILAIFKTLASQISYFEKSNSLAPIQILSTIEARLLNHDLVIIASLNFGDFPAIETENWLGKKIRKDLGIDKKLKKIGQNAYDFCNYLANENVVLSRCTTQDNSPTICSPFLLKLETLAKKMAINFDRGEKYFYWLKTFDECDIIKMQRPDPKPAIELRPKKLAITDIAKLISDPYAIYARRILRLNELQKIDYEPNYAEFGSFVHKALEEFIKNKKPPKEFLKNSEKIFEKYFLNQEAKLIWWPKFENIFINFLEQEEQLQAAENYTEISVKLVINEILVNGKIDRVILDKNNFYNIFDYKTGQNSSAKDVTSGIDPQLTIAALMLVVGVIENELKNINAAEIQSINYWKLSASTENKITKICDKNEEIRILIAAARIGLEKLFTHFADKNNGYISAPDSENFQKEYWHLARIDEWS